MKTQVVYVLTSTSDDYYLEQTLLSILTLKENTTDASVIIVMDSKTEKTLVGTRRRILDYCSQHIVVNTPDDYTQIENSRYIKTLLREIVCGDYLFVDGDTAISMDLSEIDNCKDIIAAVPDKHLPLQTHQWRTLIESWGNKIGWSITDKDKYYFNSGVFYVKDVPQAYELYKYWHKYWLESRNVGLPIDQPALGKANAALGYLIQELSGEWNCQILENGIKFLSNAKIIHYFSSTFKKTVTNCPYLFKDKTLYEDMRKNGLKVPESFLRYIFYPQIAFNEKISLLSDVDVDIVTTPLYLKLRELYTNSPQIFELLESARKRVGEFIRIIKRH